MAAENTKEKILDAAEDLFSENGFSATSVRAITSSAGVNLAALNYHFGSKDSVIDAVFDRRIRPLNEERLRLLDMVEAQAGDSSLTLEEVLRAFLAPAIRLACDPDSGGRKFMKLMGRVHSESSDFFKNMIAKHFFEVFLRFSKAFRQVLPHLREDDLIWRMHFVIGAMAHTMAHALTFHDLYALRTQVADPVAHLSDGEISGRDAEAVLGRLIVFAAAGLRADAVTPLKVG